MASILDQYDPATIIDKSIVELLGLNDAPGEKKDKMMQDMMDTVENRVLNRVLNTFNDEEVTECTNLIGQDEDKVKNFLMSHNLDIIQMTVEEVTLLKLELIGMMQGVTAGKQIVAA